MISPELLFFAVPEAADKEAVLMSEEDSGADSTSLMEMVETAPLEVNLMTTVTTIAAISPKRITFRAISPKRIVFSLRFLSGGFPDEHAVFSPDTFQSAAERLIEHQKEYHVGNAVYSGNRQCGDYRGDPQTAGEAAVH